MRLKKMLFRKHEGFSGWIVGMWIVVFLLIFVWAACEWYNVSNNCDRIRNVIAEAGLASLEYDTNEYGVSRDISLTEFTGKAESQYASFWLLCEYIEKNLGYRGRYTGVNLNGIKKYDGSFVVEGNYLDGQEGECDIDEVIFYNVKEDEVRVHKYKRSNLGLSYEEEVADSTKNPLNQTVESSSVYIDFTFPVKFLKRVYTIRKQVYLSF